MKKKWIQLVVLTLLCTTSCGRNVVQETEKTISEKEIQIEQNVQSVQDQEKESEQETEITETNSLDIDVIRKDIEETEEILKCIEIDDKEQRLNIVAVGKIDETITDRCGVREILIYEENKQIQAIQVKDGDDTIWGIEEGYIECPTKEDAMRLQDINFDGYLDLLVWGWTPNNSIPYLCWCWNPSIKQYEYVFTLQLTNVDYEKQQLVSWYKVENGLYYTDYYAVTDNNQLELVDRQIEDVRPEK